MRECSDCQLCCKLVPVKSLGKAANERCKHQSHSKGCKIYDRRPNCCRLWSCAWLTKNDTADLRRPDRAHYVIDCIPDFIEVQYHSENKECKIPCIQVWIDPKYPKAYEDPALLAFLRRRGKSGYVGLIRLNGCDGFVLWPPEMTTDGRWHISTGESSVEHTAEEVFETLNKASHG